MLLRSAIVRYAPNETWAAHEHDEMSISVVLGGDLTEAVGGREVQAGLGSVVVKPAKSVHSNRFGPSGAVFLAIWPGELIAGEVSPQAADRWRWRHDPAGLKRWIGVAKEFALHDHLGFAEEEVMALLHDDGEGRLGHEPPVRLRRIRDQLHALGPERPSVALLARALGLHPGYLTRTFRRHYGCSISDYVRRIRVRRAASILIGAAPPPIAGLAQELGFADQSHFCRTFRNELGVTPTDYRRALARTRTG
jgi:AraC family transcriptional regulator